jgi:WD40 repeat protein
MRQPALMVLAFLLATPACRSRSTTHDAPAGSLASAPAAQSSGLPGSACEQARQLRARAATLLEEGRLQRSIRAFERAEKLCASERAMGSGAIALALAELGEAQRARTLADEIASLAGVSQQDLSLAVDAKREADEQSRSMPDTQEGRKPMRDRMVSADQAWRAGKFEEASAGFLDAWKLWHPNPEALAGAARALVDLGQPKRAQRLFDRAMVEARKTAGALKLDEQNALLGTTRIAWSRDGETIAVAHGEAISILDGRTWVQRGPILLGHTQKINAVALSPDGKMVATAAADGTIRLWDAVEGKATRKLVANANIVHSVAFSPDGRLLASDSNHLVRLWDVNTTRIKDTIKGHREAVNAIAINSNGSMLAAGAYDNSIGLWDVRSAGFLRRLYREGLPGSSIAFSPDGKLLAANTARTILLWDVDSGRVAKELGDKEWADYLAFHPGGAILASASTGASSDRLLRLWDVRTGQVLRELKGHTGDPTAIAFSPDGRVVGSGSVDQTVMFWDTETGRLLHTVKRAVQRVGAVAFSVDGHSLAAVAGDERVVVFDLEAGKLSRSVALKATNVAFGIDGKGVLTADHRDRAIRVVDLPGEKVSREIAPGGAAGPGVVAWSTDRKRAAVASADGTIGLVDVESGEVRNRLKDSDRVHALAFNATGKLLAAGAGYQDKAVRVWDTESGKIVRKLPGHKDRSTAIAFSPDGRFLASGSEDRTIQLWDAKSWPPARPLQTPTGPITSIAFNAEGSLLAVGSEDSLVRVWDPVAGKIVRQLAGHDAAVLAVAFSPDGTWLASAGAHGAIRLWSVADGSHRATLRISGADSWYAFARGLGDETGYARVGGRNAQDAEQYFMCKFGSVVMPFDVCRDSVARSDFLGAVLHQRPVPED